MAALRVIDSIEEAEAKAKNNRESSCMNSFPALPAGSYFKAVYSPVHYLRVSCFQSMRKVLSTVDPPRKYRCAHWLEGRELLWTWWA